MDFPEEVISKLREQLKSSKVAGRWGGAERGAGGGDECSVIEKH